MISCTFWSKVNFISAAHSMIFPGSCFRESTIACINSCMDVFAFVPKSENHCLILVQTSDNFSPIFSASGVNPSTIASKIFGIAATRATKIFGIAFTISIRSFTPAAIIFGCALVRNSVIATIISGNASTRL